MSWSFRILVLTVVAICGLVSQIACFVPDQPLTESEMACCEQMANDCGAMDMSCCRTVPHIDAAVAAKSIRGPMPDVNAAAKLLSTSAEMPAAILADASLRNEHARPVLDAGASSLILRI